MYTCTFICKTRENEYSYDRLNAYKMRVREIPRNEIPVDRDATDAEKFWTKRSRNVAEKIPMYIRLTENRVSECRTYAHA